MKKGFTILSLALTATLSVGAQEHNMFNAADVDANGWLWFDTQAKIDKYVGTINEEDGTLATGADAKLIQLMEADHNPDYLPTTADPGYIGIGTDGVKGSDGHKTGAIMLPPASGLTNKNGGAFIVCMPSCATFSLFLSCESKMAGEVSFTTDETTDPTNYSLLRSFDGLWVKLSSAGTYTWSNIEKLVNNTVDPPLTIVSNSPIYVKFKNWTNDTLYVHGIKVTTPKQEATAIKYVNDGQILATPMQMYSIDGVLVDGNVTDVNAMRKGVYIVRQGRTSKKVIVK